MDLKLSIFDHLFSRDKGTKIALKLTHPTTTDFEA